MNLKNLIKQLFGLKKEVSGDIALDDVQKTIISTFGFPILERKRFLLGSIQFTGGGGGHYSHPELQSIRTAYFIFGLPIFAHNANIIAQKKNRKAPALWVYQAPDDFCTIGKYALHSPNLNQEILTLCQNLPQEDQERVVRQVALSKAGWQNNEFMVYALTSKEREDREKMDQEFYPHIFKISDDLYFYRGYFLCGNFFSQSTFWHKHGLKEIFSEKTLRHIRQNHIIDVGGFVGDSALIFEREFCDKTIYSFEPTLQNFACMQKNLELNHSSRIVPIQKGLGAKNERLDIALNSSGSSILFAVSEQKESIEITTLDEFVEQNQLKIGFIKVDIEGFEGEFLKGAQNTIRTQKPALLISIYHSGKDYFGIKPLIESWNLGYKMRIFKGTDYSLHVETALYCEIAE